MVLGVSSLFTRLIIHRCNCSSSKTSRLMMRSAWFVIEVFERDVGFVQFWLFMGASSIPSVLILIYFDFLCHNLSIYQ